MLLIYSFIRATKRQGERTKWRSSATPLPSSKHKCYRKEEFLSPGAKCQGLAAARAAQCFPQHHQFQTGGDPPGTTASPIGLPPSQVLDGPGSVQPSQPTCEVEMQEHQAALFGSDGARVQPLPHPRPPAPHQPPAPLLSSPSLALTGFAPTPLRTPQHRQDTGVFQSPFSRSLVFWFG